MIRTDLPGLLGSASLTVVFEGGLYRPEAIISGPVAVSLSEAGTIEISCDVVSSASTPIGSGVFLVASDGSRELVAIADLEATVGSDSPQVSLALDPGEWSVLVWASAYGSSSGPSAPATWVYGLEVASAHLLSWSEV